MGGAKTIDEVENRHPTHPLPPETAGARQGVRSVQLRQQSCCLRTTTGTGEASSRIATKLAQGAVATFLVALAVNGDECASSVARHQLPARRRPGVRSLHDPDVGGGGVRLAQPLASGGTAAMGPDATPTRSATAMNPRTWTTRLAMRLSDAARRPHSDREAQRRISTAGRPCTSRSARVCGPQAIVKKS